MRDLDRVITEGSRKRAPELITRVGKAVAYGPLAALGCSVEEGVDLAARESAQASANIDMRRTRPEGGVRRRVKPTPISDLGLVALCARRYQPLRDRPRRDIELVIPHSRMHTAGAHAGSTLARADRLAAWCSADDADPAVVGHKGIPAAFAHHFGIDPGRMAQAKQPEHVAECTSSLEKCIGSACHPHMPQQCGDGCESTARRAHRHGRATKGSEAGFSLFWVTRHCAVTRLDEYE